MIEHTSKLSLQKYVRISLAALHNISSGILTKAFASSRVILSPLIIQSFKF